jgi:hypothetical protein
VHFVNTTEAVVKIHGFAKDFAVVKPKETVIIARDTLE